MLNLPLQFGGLGLSIIFTFYRKKFWNSILIVQTKLIQKQINEMFERRNCRTKSWYKILVENEKKKKALNGLATSTYWKNKRNLIIY